MALDFEVSYQEEELLKTFRLVERAYSSERGVKAAKLNSRSPEFETFWAWF